MNIQVFCMRAGNCWGHFSKAGDKNQSLLSSLMAMPPTIVDCQWGIISLKMMQTALAEDGWPCG